MTADNGTLIDLTADIVAAHVGNIQVRVDAVATVIKNVFSALKGLGEPIEVAPEKPVRAVSIRASFELSHLVSMIDGKPYMMLKRHLSLNGYTPDGYRDAFGLPKDYPMVSAENAEKRRGLALIIGLGRRAGTGAKPGKKPHASNPSIEQ